MDKVLGKYSKSIDELENFHQLRWLEHVLRMPNHRLPRRAMLFSEEVGWKKSREGQTKTRHQSMKSLTIRLSHVNRCKLPGWGGVIVTND
uniref:SJCHGC03050 protein n=1 Tax=Schistosoma japonicum TaxID=6182 RepID=Q5BSY9_SCHJA|nr:SJCHGC03050 protein [Schistosoma japonicum]